MMSEYLYLCNNSGWGGNGGDDGGSGGSGNGDDCGGGGGDFGSNGSVCGDYDGKGNKKQVIGGGDTEAEFQLLYNIYFTIIF